MRLGCSGPEAGGFAAPRLRAAARPRQLAELAHASAPASSASEAQRASDSGVGHVDEGAHLIEAGLARGEGSLEVGQVEEASANVRHVRALAAERRHRAEIHVSMLVAPASREMPERRSISPLTFTFASPLGH